LAYLIVTHRLITFAVAVLGTYQEDSNNVYVYAITAHSEFGDYSGADYISRKIEASFMLG
jgi:uncharacterized SAM-dependent methyltransferase